ncbi:MAG: SulP family inorganic anion transporter [Sandaracinaceae bacterium]
MATPSAAPARVIEPPRTDWRGLREHWRSDLVAGFSVALVALPLALGIATASGAPPMSGLVSAVVAGLLATFLRGGHVGVNGPGNSLIVLVAGGLGAFGGGAEAFPHLLGAVVVAGALQALLGLLRLGKLGDLIPAAVVQGMLAAIGLIIVGKQAHVLFGEHATASMPLDVFMELPRSVSRLHPAATILGLISLVIVVVHPTVKNRLVHAVPAPLWVVILTVPMALALVHFDAAIVASFGRSYHLEPEMLVSIPDDLLGSLAHPDFSRIGEPAFWSVVIPLTLVTSIENIVSVKAVDKLDAHRRRSNLDRDLVAMGISSIAAGFLGGLPVLTVVARSSVNVNHGAETGWSNFLHGLLLLGFVVLLGPVIEEIALSALAGILVYTGYKLAAPAVIEDTLRKGPDHFLVFVTTIVATLEWGLLTGITIGVWAELTSHFLILGMRPPQALRALWETRFEMLPDTDEKVVMRVRGVANFMQIIRLRRALAALPEGRQVLIDFSAAMLVDNTLLEHCHDFGRRYAQAGGGAKLTLIGLEAHRPNSDHPDALRAQDRGKHEQWLTARQKQIAAVAEERGWAFDAHRSWDPAELDGFLFFRVHPFEFRDTVVRGSFTSAGGDVAFTLSDVTFDEGAVIQEVYHTTALVIHLPTEVPGMILRKEDLFARAFALAGRKDIDFEGFEGFSRKFLLTGPDEAAIRAFMTPERLRFFEAEHEYHMESSGERLAIFDSMMRRATNEEIEALLTFGQRLVTALVDGASEGEAKASAS